MSEALKWKGSRLAGLALAAAAASFAGAGGAEAQPFFGVFGYRSYDVPAALSPELVYRDLVRSGFQPIGRIQRNGRVFLADVIDPRRRQLRLVIDGFDGSILERYVIASRAPMPLEERPLTQAPTRLEERGLARTPAPMADPNLPPPRLLPAPSTARAEPEPGARPVKPRTVSRQPGQESTSPRNRAAVAPAPTSEPQSQPKPAEVPTETAEAAAPAPSRTPKAQATKPPAPKAEGPGFANGVPINPLD